MKITPVYFHTNVLIFPSKQVIEKPVIATLLLLLDTSSRFLRNLSCCFNFRLVSG